MNRVVVTGIGIICGNASDKTEFLSACTEGRIGIKKCTAFNTEGLLTDYFGEADIKTDDTDERLHYLIEKACTEMLEDSGMDKQSISADGRDCRLFYGTLLSNSGAYYKHSINKSEGKTDNGVLAHMNDYIMQVKALTGIRGSAYISSAACASGTTAAGMAMDYIRNGICNAAVVGGADPLTIISAYGFNALKSLSSGICNPYDENRDGINIGECGAFLMLESLEHAKARNAEIYCELSGYATGNDAYHITSPEPEGSGAVHTMLAALKDGNTQVNEIDYINGHGTGTAINDSMEGKAARIVFGESGKKPMLSSTKALIGHCMGASGTAELISTILSMKHKKAIYMPSVKSSLAEGECADILTESRSVDISCALSNSFAFAGNSASLLIKKYDGGDEA